MYCFENEFLSTFNLQPTAYFRNIDDIFLIWPLGIDTLETFIEDANRTHQNIHTYTLVLKYHSWI